MLIEQKFSESLCNRNNICDGFENYLSCKVDCKWYEEDGICNSETGDYFCDADCVFDDDCGKVNCNDGIRNQNEIGIDSGGVCELGHCFDNVKNYDETETDCGGICGECEIILTEDFLFSLKEFINGRIDIIKLLDVVNSWIGN